MNLEDLRRRSRELAGIRQTELAPDPRVTDLINESYRELAAAETWPWLYIDVPTVSVAVGQSEVSLPIEFRLIEGVLFGSKRLRNVTVTDLDLADIERTGDPFAYARLAGDRLLIAPAPDAAGTLRVRGYRTVPRLVSAADVPLFDEEFHHVLAYAAAVRLLGEEGDDSGRVDQYAELTRGIADDMRSRYVQSHEKTTFGLGSRSVGRTRWRLR